MEGSVAEAVMSLGIERNSDIIETQMYAPFFSNLHYNREGKPRLISFDVDPGQTVLSTSYHVLKLLATTHPKNARTLELKSDVGVHPLYWTASLDEDVGTVYVKVANAGEKEQVVSVNLKCGEGKVVAGERLLKNTPKEKENVGIKDLLINTREDGTSDATMPKWSIVVLTCAS